VDALAVLEAAPEMAAEDGAFCTTNLACYEARFGGHQNRPPVHECGGSRLNSAMEKKEAQTDPDLQGLWN